SVLDDPDLSGLLLREEDASVGGERDVRHEGEVVRPREGRLLIPVRDRWPGNNDQQGHGGGEGRSDGPHPSACARSSIRSSGCSMPTESRIRSPGTSKGEPATLAWVIGPGTSINDSTPPSDSARKNRRVRSATRIASSAVATWKETMPPKSSICRR